MIMKRTDPGGSSQRSGRAFRLGRELLKAIVATALLTAPSGALACGNPLLWAMLFAKVPDAKVVYEAELTARAEGHVTARVYNAKPGQPYHQWSKAWILELASEMQPEIQKNLDAGEQITVLLADEVAVLRFSSGEPVKFIPPAGLRNIERFDLITTTNALKSVWRDGLTYSEFLARDLARGSAGPEAIAVSRALALE